MEILGGMGLINKSIYEKIEDLAEDSVSDIFYALAEEVGELALALHVEQGNKIRNLKEDSKTETIDVILVAIEMYIRLGGKYEEIDEIVKRKLDKWEASMVQRRRVSLI